MKKNMTAEKSNVKRDIIDILGNAIGVVGSGLIAFTMYRILTNGYAHYIEKNRYVAMAELGIGLSGMAFFIYKLAKASK